MVTELDLEIAHETAKKAFDEIVRLPEGEQFSALRERSKAIEDGVQRISFEHLVFGMLKTHNQEPAAQKYLNVAFGPEGTALIFFLVSIAVCLLEFRFKFLWALISSLVVAILIRMIFRMFDRAFFFRRLIATWFFSGLLLVSAPSLVIMAKTDFATFEWGGPPSVTVSLVWCLGLVVNAFLAFHEMKRN
ncbi:hypothetical protein [Roseovarius aquimarinus]|uniref:Uncharacterized protein n=1 Tax=Roseovarius aquimarinus TaxID=1229156 RepID=A0ABW7I7Q8_9RHOB